VPGMPERGAALLDQLRRGQVFNQEDMARLRAQFGEDLNFLSRAQIITSDDCSMFAQIFPLFSPQFLSYDFDKAVYQSIPEAIAAAFPGCAAESERHQQTEEFDHD
jgi:hypothetical protein